MVHHYLKLAFRHLWKYKIQNLIGVVGLAVGLVCFSICFYLFRLVNEMDQCYENSDRLVDVIVERPANEEREASKTNSSNVDLTLLLREASLNGAEAFCTVSDCESRAYHVEISADKTLPFNLRTLEVDTFYNQLFSPQLLEGSWEYLKNQPNAVILTESSGRRIFGDKENPIGKTMKLVSQLRSSPPESSSYTEAVYTVQAIMKDLPLNISASFLEGIDMLVVNDTEGWIQADFMRRNSQSNSRTHVLLTKGTTAKDLQQEIDQRKLKFNPFGFGEENILIYPVGQHVKEYAPVQYLAWIAFSIGILILVVGLLNFFYFLCASFQNRMREYALRKTMGNTRFYLFGMLWMQTLLILSVAGMLVWILIELLAPYLYLSIGKLAWTIETSSMYKQTMIYWLFLAGLCTILCMVVTVVLDHKATKRGLAVLVKKKTTHYFRNIMLGIQFFITWIFIACTFGLFLQTRMATKVILNTLTMDEKKAIFNVRLSYPFLSVEEKEELIGRIAAFSGVQDLTRSNNDLVRGKVMTSVRCIEGDNTDKSWKQVFIYSVDSSFFKVMNISLTAGRPMHRGEMVVSESFAEEEGEVLGKSYDRYLVINKVTGVAENITYTLDPWEREIRAVMYEVVYDAHYLNHCYVRARPGSENEVRRHIEQEVQKNLPENVGVQLSTLADDIYQTYAAENQMKKVILLLSVVCLILTLLGVYSSVMLDTTRRQKEIVIRKINGARVIHIVYLFFRLYALLIIFTALFAFPLVGLLFKEGQQMYALFFEYGPFFWIVVFLSVSLITGLTIFYRIFQVARINPSEAIRNE